MKPSRSSRYGAADHSNAGLYRQKIQCIGHYDLVKTIGQGQFGKVKLAKHVLTGEKVAVKIIKKSKLDDKSLKKVYREVHIMKMLNHPNVIKLFEVVETDNILFLIMEYASGGEVLDLIVAHGKLDEDPARKFLAQLVEAVDYCHKRYVIHRDIKCENMLLTEDRTVKVIDFGLSNSFTPGSLMNTFCGSPTYCAPELVQRKEYKGPEIDVWSIGVVLFVLVCGYLPFDARDFRGLFMKILSGRYKLHESVSADCADLIARMLEVDPRKRITLAEVRQHRWLIQGDAVDLLVPNARVDDVLTFSSYEEGELDAGIFAQMAKMGFNEESLRASVKSRNYDSASATYALLLERKRRMSREGSREPSPTRRLVPPPSAFPTQVIAGVSSTTGLGFSPPSGVGVPPAHPASATRGKRGHRRYHTADVTGIQQMAPPVHPAPLLQPVRVFDTPTVPTSIVSSLPPSLSQPPTLRSSAGQAPTLRSTRTPQRSSRPSTAQPSAGSSAPRRAEKKEKTSMAPPPARLSRSRTSSGRRKKLIRHTVHGRPQSSSERDSKDDSKRPVLKADVPSSPLYHTRKHLHRAEKARSEHKARTRTRHPSADHTESISGRMGRLRISKSELPSPTQPAAPPRIQLSPYKPPGPNRRPRSSGSHIPSSGPLKKESERAGGDSGTPSTPGPDHGRGNRGHRRAVSLDVRKLVGEAKTGDGPAPASVIRAPVRPSGGGFWDSFRTGFGLLSPAPQPEPSPGRRQPRTFRFAFNMHTTSSKSPETIMAEVALVLKMHGIPYAMVNDYSLQGRHEKIVFEVEVCKLPILSMNGLRLARISGDVWKYKELCARLVKQMDL